jgi:membrane protease YdiL (CAAX protease family)
LSAPQYRFRLVLVPLPVRILTLLPALSLKVQGYNYPGRPVLGTLAMVLFCTGMSFILTAVRRLTGSVLPVAAAHGTFNALAPIVLILAPGTDSVLTGPLGATGTLILTVIGGCLWFAVRRSEGTPATSYADGTTVGKGWQVR